MKPSQTHAASRGKMNSSLSSKYGTPHNVSTGSGGICSGSKAASRPAVNSTITGKKFFEGPNDFGHKGVS